MAALAGCSRAARAYECGVLGLRPFHMGCKTPLGWPFVGCVCSSARIDVFDCSAEAEAMAEAGLRILGATIEC